MASVGDYIFLIIVLSIIGGIVYAVKGGQIKSGMDDAQQKMRQKGITLNSSGVSIKTDRRAPTRDEYIDSTRDSFARSSETINKHKSAFTNTALLKKKELEEQAKASRASGVGGAAGAGAGAGKAKQR
ncbi:unnamed protein product [Jaminaea pallidilutea]